MSTHIELGLFDLSLKTDTRGSLVALESQVNIPFEIQRVYYIFRMPIGAKRGYHAHKTLEQLLVCVAGSCKVMLDDGEQTVEKVLDKPWEGLFVDKLIWHEMYDFSQDCVLLVLASAHYSEEDYIRDYTEFTRVCKL